MKKSKANRVFAAALALSMVGCVQYSFADTVVVVHPSNNESLSKKEVQRIFLGKLKTFPSNKPVIPIDLPQKSEVREVFSESIIKKDMRQLAAYWSRLIFTGKGLPPKQVSSSKEAKELVARNPDAIAYIDSSLLDDTVKQLVF